MSEKEEFLWGVVTALLTLHAHGAEVTAVDVVNSVGGLPDIKRVIEKHGDEAELSLLDWLNDQPKLATK